MAVTVPARGEHLCRTNYYLSVESQHTVRTMWSSVMNTRIVVGVNWKTRMLRDVGAHYLEHTEWAWQWSVHDPLHFGFQCFSLSQTMFSGKSTKLCPSCGALLPPLRGYIGAAASNGGDLSTAISPSRVVVMHKTSRLEFERRKQKHLSEKQLHAEVSCKVATSCGLIGHAQ